MAKFKKGPKKGIGTISTASLPDIIFMLLFFFMVSTTIREVELKVRAQVPGATEVKKLEKKSLVSYIYIGEPKPKYQNYYGTNDRIQLNDAFSDVESIKEFIYSERNSMDEADQAYMTVSLKIDKEAKMGVVVDVKQALRKASALKINYSAKEVASVY